jgi:hypothetical protein
MDPLSIVRKVYLREYRRFAFWAGEWFDAPQAHRLSSQALAILWWDASGARPTQLGPYQYLYAQAESMMRYRLESAGRTLPAGAAHRLLVPAPAELDELVRVYCTIAIASRLAGLNHRDRGLIAGFIRKYDPDDETPMRGTWTQEAENATQFVRDRLVAALLSEVQPAEDAGLEVGELYLGEVQRSKTWLSNHEHRRAEQHDGGEQQDHDPGDAG